MITSTRNTRIKDIVRLRRKGERDATGRFPIEGAREVARALEAGADIDELVYSAQLLSDEGQRLVAAAGGVELVEVDATVFGAVSYRERPDGVLAVARTFDTDLDRLAVDRDALVLVAAEIEKPGNLGAMLRSAAAADVDAVLVADGVTDVFNPNVVRASLGALFSIPVAVADAAGTVAWLRRRGLRVIAASPEGPTPYWTASLAAAAVVIGAEHRGLPPIWLDAADELVRVPMATGRGVDSLNASATAAVLLFEAVRQRAVARTT